MPGDVGQGTSGLVLLLGAVIGPGNRLTCISLKQESPGPLTHLSCLHITHCLLELLDKSPIPSAGSSRSKETHRLPYPPSFFVLCSASYTCGVPCGWGGSVCSTRTPHIGVLSPKLMALTLTSSFLPFIILPSQPPASPVRNSPPVANVLTRFPRSWPRQARTAHVLPASWWFPAPLPCPRHECLNVQVSPGTGAGSMDWPCREWSSMSVLAISDH